MIKRSIQQSAVVMMLSLGLLFTAAAPSVTLAQDRCRSRQYETSRYDGNRYYDQRDYGRDRDYDRRDYDRNRNYDYYYQDRQDTTGNAVKRTGIGAAIGAIGGGLLGGKKGAVIGAGVGAAGGYIYHRHKVNQERGRYGY